MNSKKTEWVKIKGFDNYEISSNKIIRKINKKLFIHEYAKTIKTSRGCYVILESKNFKKNKNYIIKKIDYIYALCNFHK
tara:strand:- start:123 stop:359 length:237 start_codon:yes stop_codon:yes gene_type:complete